ncbi:polysaccharide pyruvyl transferase family protein [Horticoccus luteus]|uniref:Polysaccharide pyruvyl transferase family protein n=1 Tax=Horticoccus luteus TaxID=2862869 RepID=A0A8F9XMK5_9BACT|nr:polysaccharide pyruvyl transferase family protein [Horticoccus luteus]QYM80336.1 polysaccharide pyruvyl transferase family protein [Horticoccus luteus]
MNFPNRNGALVSALQSWRGREIVMLLNRGTRSDGLSHLGSRALLQGLGLAWKECGDGDRPNDVRGDILLVHGASGLSHGDGGTIAKCVAALAPRFAHVVLLPATFDLRSPRVQRFVENWTAKYIVFCREMVSFDSLHAAGARPGSLQLGHDLAFHVDYSDWKDCPATGRAGIFRRDREAAFGRLPRELDAWNDAAQGTEREPQRLLDYIARFEKIYTDRSHAAIAAAMMGREVVFYRNIFFKNRAIYEHSLAPLSQVTFSEPTPFSTGQFMRAVYWGRVRPVQDKVMRLFQWRRADSPTAA